MRDAVRFVVRDRRLFVVFVVFTLVGTFGFNYSVSLLKIADLRFHDERWFGYLLASTGFGSMVGSLLTAARSKVTTRWFFGAGMVMGLTALVVAWSPNAWFALVASVPLGMGGAAFISAQNAIAQQESPPDMRGRLLALGAVAFLGSTPIGAPITGWIADHVGAEWSLGYGGLITLAAVTIGATVMARRRAAALQPEAAAAGSVP